MKIRNGFVSNSSSSSFVCEICGHADGGMDYTLDDVGMCECENHHVFCREHLLDYKEYTSYGIPQRYCPICSLEYITGDDMLRFLVSTKVIDSVKEIQDEITRRFSTYKEFKHFVEG